MMQRAELRSARYLTVFLMMASCVPLILPTLAVAQSASTAGSDRAAERILDFDPDWTPRPVEGDVPAYVKETDVDWVDGRLQQMDTGRTWNATFRYPETGPPTKEGPTHRSFKGTAVRLGERGEAGMIFDRNQCRWACAWTGDFLLHSDRRFGLLNTPRPAGEVQFFTKPDAGWSPAELPWHEETVATGPLPREIAHFEGTYRHGERTVFQYRVGETTVLESPWFEEHSGVGIFTRTFRIDPVTEPQNVLLRSVDAEVTTDDLGAVIVGGPMGCRIERLEGRVVLTIPASDERKIITVAFLTKGTPESNAELLTSLEAPTEADFDTWTSAGPQQSTERIVTSGKVAPDDGPYVIDTIGVPFDNPYKALMFLSGVDFVRQDDGPSDVYVSTVHGDVWKLTGVDADLNEVVWKRYATGLYQPLGLKVVDGKVFVLERGQLTRLHDLNSDGEADFFESFNGDWHVGGGEHSFDTCLESDPEGNFYFHSTGDPQVPTGGTVIKVSPDGQRSEVFCTGFRHPIGMGVLPDGRITGADQEGNWMPSTRIDIYRKGGFYGDLRCHHCETPPETFDGPLCWLPRQLDGSAGGQVAVPDDQWGPLAGRVLHMSFGRCRLILLMMQRIGDIEQAGAVDLGLQFDSGIQRGRFRPDDGHLYLVGMDGWQTAAIADGCLQRVRYTGQRWMSPTDLAIEPDGIRLTFSQPLDPGVASNAARYHVEQWNYHWSGEYGSARYSVESPGTEGQDVVPIHAATVSEDGREVFLTVPNLRPVMQMQIDYRLTDAEGRPVEGVVYNTIHTTGD